MENSKNATQFDLQTDLSAESIIQLIKNDEVKKIHFGALHCHSEESLRDSGLPVKKLIDVAIEMGCPSVALTDHGVMMGVMEFMSYAKSINEKAGKKVINAIPGVEAYKDGKHIVLLGMDYEHGYKAIIKAVTESYKHINSSNGHPHMTDEIFQTYFGPGSKGHGYVIALSGCMSGVLCKILNSNEDADASIAKLLEKMKQYNNPEDETYLKNLDLLKQKGEEIKALMEHKKELSTIVGRSFVKKEKAVALLKKNNDPSYQEAYNNLQKEKEEVAEATKELEELKLRIKSEKTKESMMRNSLKEIEKTHASYIACKEKIEGIQASKMTQEDVYEATKKEALRMEEIFGKGRFFIELQNHRIDEEIRFFPVLLRISKELGIDCVATNDVHTATNSYEDVRVRQVQRFQRFTKYESISESDYHLCLKSDADMLSILSEIIPEEDAAVAIANAQKVASLCDVVFPKESHYPKFITEDGLSADETIRKKAYERIPLYYKENEWTEEYEQRLRYELDVICNMGYSDYHLIVQDFLNVGRRLGRMSKKSQLALATLASSMSLEEFMDYVDSHQEDLGYAIGPGRGSAAGSLVCYLLGITNIDPIKYNLLFERFLNVERVSMPDIDSDISPDVRDLLIEYIKKRYGEEAVCCIATRGTQAAKEAIRTSARFLGAEKKDDTTYYYNLGDEISKSIPNEVGITLKKAQEQLDDYVSSVEDKELRTVSQEIIDLACMIEGRLSNYGMHAAGVVIADNGDVKEYVPLMYNTKKERWCCQCDMGQVEESGLLKMDALGLKTMKIITDTIRKIRKNYGITVDMDKIPFEPEVFSSIYSKGKTNGVFQVESNGMKEMLMNFKPDCIEDIVLLVAAYRPGPMQYLENVIDIKHGKKELKYLTPELESILSPTYGSTIYQEQVQQIFQKLAGYSLGQADLVRRAMSKKKEKVLLAERESFINGDEKRNIVGCVKNGISASIANQLFDEMIDFAKYAFNRSHAAAYAIVSYQTAWLKYHYPAEFLCATMNLKDNKDLPLYFEECRENNIEISALDINYSDVEFMERIDDEGNMSIVFGLSKVKGIKSASTQIVETRDGGYDSFYDYMLHGHIRKDVTENLIRAGAFDIFCENRTALLRVLGSYLDILKKIKDKNKDIAGYEATLAGELDEKKRKSTMQCLERARKTLAQYEAQLKEITIPNIPEDRKAKLDDEYEVLGTYVTGHPLDIYDSDLPVTSFADMVPGKEYYALVQIRNLRVVERKKDGKPLAFFTASDKTFNVDAQCFTKAYAQVGHKLKDLEAVVLKGKYNERVSDNYHDDDDDGPEIERTFSISEVHDVIIKRKNLIVSMPIIDWNNVRMVLKTMESPHSEYKLYLHDVIGGSVRETDTVADIENIVNLGLSYAKMM